MRRQLTFLGILVALTVSTFSLSGVPTYADDAPPLYDWTIRLVTQRLERQFEYDGSNLRPVDRVDVDIYSQDNEQANTAYESLWYHNGQPLGLERFNQFGLPRGQGACIRVRHRTNNPTTEELQAAGNMILRAWLEASVNQNAVITVKVPQQSFSAIINYLQTRGCVQTPAGTPEEEKNVPMPLSVESDPPGQTELLSYS